MAPKLMHTELTEVCGSPTECGVCALGSGNAGAHPEAYSPLPSVKSVFKGFLMSIFTQKVRQGWARNAIINLSTLSYSSQNPVWHAALHHCGGRWSTELDFMNPESLKGFHCMFSAMCTNSPVFGMYLSFLFACTLCLPVSYHQGYRMILGQTYAT